jgi:hypothetical protein
MNELHYRYWIGMLVAVLIAVLTVDWAKINDLAQIFSFGLTLSSLVLAIIAIFQTQFSQASVGETAGKMNSAAEDVRVAITQIETASKNILEQTGAIPGALGEISSKFDQLQEKVLNTNADLKDQTKVSPTQGGRERRFGKSTYGVTVALYLCVEAHKNKLLFDAKDIFQSDFTGKYVQGVVGGLRVSEFFDIELDEGSFRVLDLKDFDTEVFREAVNSRSKSSKFVAKAVKEIDVWVEKQTTTD